MRMISESRVPQVDVTIDINGNSDSSGVRAVLNVVRPEWDLENVHFKLLTDGITNKLIACRAEGTPESDTVLIRIYGNKTDLFIDRKAEKRNILFLNQYGLAPNLYAIFNNGLSYEFVPGRTLDVEIVRQPKIYKLVAKHMTKLHKVKVEGVDNPEPSLWKKLDAFLSLVPEVFDDREKQKRFETLIVPKSRIQEEVNSVRTILEILNSPIVFCHNDLLLGNVIYTEDKQAVTLIDFEYAAFNYQGFDIANHFAEFAGVDNPDYSRYPGKDFQYEWLTTYLTEFTGQAPTSEEVETLYKQVNKFTLASHLFWGIWALIQAEHSYIDFDFMGYGAMRFNEYFARKQEFLSL